MFDEKTSAGTWAEEDLGGVLVSRAWGMQEKGRKDERDDSRPG